jgi:hypothetical protein
MSAALRELMIREEAYALAERRGFAPGHEVDDWLAAEHKVNELCDRIAAAGNVIAGDLQKPQWFIAPRTQWRE